MSVVIMKNKVLNTLLITALVLNSGCGMLGKSSSRLPSNFEMDNSNPNASQFNAVKERSVYVTLVGAHRLNQSTGGSARSVQTCLYLAKDATWSPGLRAESSTCLTPMQDANIIASERRIMVPDQLQQISFTLSTDYDLWLVVDADFAERAVDYEPLRMRIKSNLPATNLAVWLDAHCIYDGLAARPNDQTMSCKGGSNAQANQLDGLSVHYSSEKK